jgi:GDPmannose 4,6-dehydratase
VRDFVNAAAAGMDLELDWQGAGQDECAVVAWSERDDLQFRVGDVVVQIDPRYYRPTEVETLLGDASLAREKLGWVPSISFEELVEEMVTNDLRLAREEALVNRDRNDQ